MEMEGKSLLSSCDSTVTQYWLCILRADFLNKLSGSDAFVICPSRE